MSKGYGVFTRVVTAFAGAWHASMRGIRWCGVRLYRWLSAVLFALAMSAESVMHSLGIPHVEGWWMPLLGSSVAVGAMGAYWHRARAKRS